MKCLLEREHILIERGIMIEGLLIGKEILTEDQEIVGVQELRRGMKVVHEETGIETIALIKEGDRGMIQTVAINGSCVPRAIGAS